MTQKEFDQKMSEINAKQEEATAFTRLYIDNLHSLKLDLKAQISELYHRLDLLAQDLHREETKLKSLNRDYHQKKHQLNLQWRFENGESPAEAGE